MRYSQAAEFLRRSKLRMHVPATALAEALAERAALSMAASRSVTLNVGGTKFESSRSTLCDQSVYFQRLLSGEFSDADADGAIFIDRDPRYFHIVLQFLRSGLLEPPQPPLTLDGALAEAEYFCVEALVAALQERLEPPAPGPPVLRAGTGMYVWEDGRGGVECVHFGPDSDDQAVADVSRPFGTLVYSRGPCARENLVALRAMPKPLPRIWHESGDASTLVAFFAQRWISRGTFSTEGNAVMMTRGGLEGGDPLGVNPASTVVTVGLLLPSAGGGDLLLLEPSVDSSATPRETLLEQLMHAAGGTGAAAAAQSLSRGSAGSSGAGGFKRFVFEPEPPSR